MLNQIVEVSIPLKLGLHVMSVLEDEETISSFNPLKIGSTCNDKEDLTERIAKCVSIPLKSGLHVIEAPQS